MENSKSIFSKIFDGIVTAIFTLFSVVYYPIAFIVTYVLKFFKLVIWDLIIYGILKEIYDLFMCAFSGIFLTLKFFAYDIPQKISSSISNGFKNAKRKLNSSIERTTNNTKFTFRDWKNAIIDKYNSISLVRYFKNKEIENLDVISVSKTGEDAARSEVKHAYKYIAKNKEGRIIKGYFLAFSRLDTYSYLMDEDYEVYEIKTDAWIDFVHGQSSIFSNAKMKNKDLIFWLTQLSTYVKSGVTLTEAVKILAGQNKKSKYKRAFDSMIYELTMGESFSEALRKQGNMFPGLLINMVRAAEKIGNIESTLDEMAEYYDTLEKNRKAVMNALTYPIIILVFATGVIAFIMGYIIPKFAEIYDSLGADVPGYTKAIIAASNFIANKWMYLILGIIGFVILFYVAYRNFKVFKIIIQSLLMHFPLIGNILIYKEITIFSKTFASLTRNNVSLTESMDILSKITDNELYKEIMLETVDNLMKGDKMSESFKNKWEVPDLAYYMISTGESTGELADMLDKVADYFQNQQRNLTERLKAFIEPIMIIFLAVVVGGIILSIIIPLFGIYNSIKLN